MIRVLITLCLVFASLIIVAAPGSGSEPALSGIGPVPRARPGDLLLNGAVGVIVPPPGRGVWGEAVLDDGRTDVLGVEIGADGSVTVSSWEDSDGIGLLVLPTSPPECEDDAQSTLSFQWTKTFRWFFNARTTPAGLSKRGVESALRRATRNITRNANTCNLADEVGATASYRGRLRKRVQITQEGACRATGDRRSQTSFGTLPAGTLGIACIWYRGDGTATESDVRLNRAPSWTVKISDSCIDKWNIEAVTTHERGHTFGLGHVSEEMHGNLTMSPRINGPCQKSEARLGRGDVLALRSLY